MDVEKVLKTAWDAYWTAQDNNSPSLMQPTIVAALREMAAQEKMRVRPFVEPGLYFEITAMADEIEAHK